MRDWLALLGAIVLCLVSVACADTGKETKPLRTNAHHSGVTLPQPELKSDGELDADSYPGEPDNDNNHVFGRPARVADVRAATALVKRYYAAAAADDGVAACALIYSVLAESIPEDYGPPGKHPSHSIKSCGLVMSKLFKPLHKRLSIDSATLKVAAVRIRGNVAAVSLSFSGMKPKNYLELHRERGAWKIDRPLGDEQPIYVE